MIVHAGVISVYHYFIVSFVLNALIQLCGCWYHAATVSLQSCLTLCDPIDDSRPGSPIPGVLQARTLEWVAISFSNAGKWRGKVKSLSRVWLLATPWTAAHQAPLSMGFSRQEYCSGSQLASLDILLLLYVLYAKMGVFSTFRIQFLWNFVLDSDCLLRGYTFQSMNKEIPTI